MDKDKVYDMITERVIEKLQQGIVAWKRPWHTILPCNFKTKTPYKGINAWMCMFNDFKSPYYLTYKQVTDMKGNVKKGSKGTPIIYWDFKKFEKEKADGTKEMRQFAFLKYFTVFNAEQIEGIEFPEVVNNVRNVEVLDALFNNMPNAPERKEGIVAGRACYIPMMDIINMPAKQDFFDTDGYYATLSHEYIHSTGHSKRLNREGIIERHEKGSPGYAFEELIAEMGCAFLCNMAGITTREDNTVAYINSWIKALKNDNTLIIKAAKEAEKAVKYMKGELETKEQKMEEKEAA